MGVILLVSFSGYWGKNLAKLVSIENNRKKKSLKAGMDRVLEGFFSFTWEVTKSVASVH